MKIVCILLFVVLGTLAQVNDDISLWPQPVELLYGESPVQVSTNLQFVCEEAPCSDVLTIAFIRYLKYIFFANNSRREMSNDAPVLSSVNIVVAQQNVTLEIGVDESYQLTVDTNGQAVIKANNDWGALRGLDTFSQLVNIDIPSGNYFIQHTPITIFDSPRFPWRGLLIDSSRHFLDIPSIMRQLDGMEAGKMNVLHWHISDDQSFPLQSNEFPLLSEKGAWSPDSIYSPDDVQFIIQYARLRGIIVVPEFDMPAHANSWFKGYPELGTPCAPEFYKLVDASNPNTYQFVGDFLSYVTGVFPSNYIHLGSDEVGYDCWKNSTEIQEFMKKHNITTEKGVHNYFEVQVQGITKELGKQTILWEEAFDSGFNISSDSIIEVWLSIEELQNVVKSGYHALLAKGFYLDQENPGDEDNYFWEDTWKDFYLNDPVGNFTFTDDELELILGGEACMWGEGVDSHVIDCRVWPRALAVAERLWSPQSVTDVDYAQDRLIVHRCRLVRRGISASPIRPDYCYTGQNQQRKWKLF